MIENWNVIVSWPSIVNGNKQKLWSYLSRSQKVLKFKVHLAVVQRNTSSERHLIQNNERKWRFEWWSLTKLSMTTTLVLNDQSRAHRQGRPGRRKWRRSAVGDGESGYEHFWWSWKEDGEGRHEGGPCDHHGGDGYAETVLWINTFYLATCMRT